MAKRSLKEREVRRLKLAQRYKNKRSELCKILYDHKASYDDKMAASKKLSEIPRDSSRSRQRTRCQICGRPRAVYRKFGLCRMHLKEAVMRADVPGVTKASW